MRKPLTSLLTAVTLAVALIGGSMIASTTAAEAAACAKWQLPLKTTIKQSNNTLVNLANGRSGWRASHGRTVSTEVVFYATRRPNLVRFIITWSNHTAGVYDGTIDADGFVTGYTYDRFNNRSRATWTMGRLASCVR